MNKTAATTDTIMRNSEEWGSSVNEPGVKLSLSGQIAGLELSGLDGFSGFNPSLPASSSQGVLECIHDVQTLSCSMTGLAAASLVALTASQACFACLSMIKKYHQRKKQSRSKLLLCEDMPELMLAARQANFDVISVSLHELDASLDDEVAAIILPLPAVEQPVPLTDSIQQRMSELDVLTYLDGCGQYFYHTPELLKNLAVDLISLDLAQLCETNPPCYAVVSNERLQSYLPVPRVERIENDFLLQAHRDKPFSIGSLNAGVGNIEAILRCYVALRLKGVSDIQQEALKAVISAYYVSKKLADAGLDKYFYSPPSSGLLCVSSKHASSLKLSVEQVLESYTAKGLNFQVDNNDGNDFSISVGRLHYLTKKELDEIVEFFISLQ